jgi:hypothetical protein
MTEPDRIKYLRVALLVVGMIFTFGLWPLRLSGNLAGRGIPEVVRSILR